MTHISRCAMIFKRPFGTLILSGLRFPVALFVFYAAGCSSTRTNVEEGYRGTTISGKTLAVASVMPTISNPEDVTSNLGEGNPGQVFLRFFSLVFLRELESVSSFKTITFARREASEPLYWRTPPIESGEILNIALPADGVSVEFDSLRSEFVLFIGRFLVFRSQPQAGYQEGVGVTGGTSGMLTFSADYAIWDNTRGAMVSYGRAVAESHIPVFRMTRWNWESCSRQLAAKVTEGSPFRK